MQMVKLNLHVYRRLTRAAWSTVTSVYIKLLCDTNVCDTYTCLFAKHAFGTMLHVPPMDTRTMKQKTCYVHEHEVYKQCSTMCTNNIQS